MIKSDENFETWKIYPKEASQKATFVKSDRPMQLKKSKLAARFNWTQDGKLLIQGNFYELLRMVEWRIYFVVNPGTYGFNPKDDFELP